jgi:hypothetical protein
LDLAKAFGSVQQYFVVGCFLVFSFVVLFSAYLTRIAPAVDLSSYSPSVFNLFFYVPAGLWIGILGLCGLFIYLFINPKGLSPNFANAFMFLIMLLVLGIFFGLPYAVENNPRFVDSWVHGSTAKNVFETHFLNPQRQNLYLSYPLSFTFLSVLSYFSALDLTVLLRFLPLGLVLMFISSLTVFFNKLLNDFRLSVVAVFVFALTTFYFAFHFSPEIFGWLFFLLFFAFLAKAMHLSHSGKAISKSDSIIIMFLIVAIALTHPVTQFTVLIILTTLVVLGSVFWKVRYVSSNFLLFAAIVFVAWATYFGFLYFQIIIQGFENAFRTIILSPSASIASRALTSYTPPAVEGLSWFRRLLYAFTLLLGVFGGFFFFRRKSHSFRFMLGFLITGLLMLPFTLVGILPLERPIKIVFLPLSLFVAFLISDKKKLGVLLLAFVLLTVPINFASVYWNEASTMTHDWEVNSAQFVSGNFHGNLLGEFKEVSIMEYYGNFNAIFDDYSLYGERPNVFNITFIEQVHIEVVYITQLTLERATGIGIDVDLDAFRNSTNFNCVHSNGYSSVFFRKDVLSSPSS